MPSEINPDVARFNRWAKSYDQSLMQRWYFGPVHSAMLEGLAADRSAGVPHDVLDVHECSRVLEVSVGTGMNLRFLPPTAQYVGLDISWGMLRRCHKSLRRWHRQALLVQGAAEHLPFVDGALDAVLHMGGINCFNDKAQVLREMVRVAKPGITFVIVDETEKITRRYDKTPVAGAFYANQHSSAHAPVE
jgi:ubiquinone/menaquinone biosynthesis C-methylase UbiE